MRIVCIFKGVWGLSEITHSLGDPKYGDIYTLVGFTKKGELFPHTSIRAIFDVCELLERPPDEGIPYWWSYDAFKPLDDLQAEDMQTTELELVEVSELTFNEQFND
jgi:hypothetical protein